MVRATERGVHDMSEARLWRTLRDAVGKKGHWDRIESHAVSQGRPDVNACRRGKTVDIELKVYDVRRGGFVLRSSQNTWMINRTRAGGRVWIFARFDHVDGETYFLIPGERSRSLIHDRSVDGWLGQATHVWENKPDWGDFLGVVFDDRS